MPKPETIEDFNVIIHHVPKERLGEVYAALAKLDLNEIEANLVTHIPTFAKKGNHEIKSTEFLLTWIVDHPTFKAIEAVNAFKADGRGNGTTAYPALSALVESKILKKVGQGEYARADQKALPAPKKKGAKPHKTFDKPGTEVILSYARRNHGRFNMAKLLDLFEAEGRARNSVYAPIDKLLKAKMIKLVGDKSEGQYILLNKAQTERKKALVAEKQTPKTNGNGTEAVVEAGNG